MTEEPQQMQLPPMPPVDQGNPILNEGPAVFQCTPVNIAGGQRLAMTIRTPTTTMTVLLMKDDASNWRDTMTEGIGKMSGLILANGSLPR